MIRPQDGEIPIGMNPSVRDMGESFMAWLALQSDELAPFREPLPEAYEARAERVRALQRVLFDAGWARYGWPPAVGGLGGTVLHRAALIEALARTGYPPRLLLEHLEILPPALIKYGDPTLMERLLPPTLRGDILWCQGFSEPSAGSDLASLKTRAAPAGGGFRIDGHKIWTSWAKFADYCLVLARTGATEDRHRGISAFVVDLESPGVTVRAIRQANGTDELAEVFFDGVVVPEEQRVGGLHEGWNVTMEILAGERGSYGWLRQAHLLTRLEHLARTPGASENPRALGEALVHLLALRCRSREVLEILADGRQPGPESSVSKVLVIDGDRIVYEVARELLSPHLDLGTLPEAWEWQESYFYSRASGIYGGTRQIQLNVIAKLMLKTGGAAHRHQLDAEFETVRSSVVEAAEQSASARDALEGLEWWAFAAQPEGSLGRAAFTTWFEHQGDALLHGPALAGVAAAAIAEALGAAAADVTYGIGSPQVEGEVTRSLAIGWDAQSRWLALPGDDGTWLAAPATAVEATPWSAMDPAMGCRVCVVRSALRRVEVDGAAHDRALARIAAAFEILGAARALTDLVVDYTNQREQFGQPLSGFQAVQHMLSECQVDLASITSLADAALEQWCAGEGEDAARAAKARAGRAGRRIAQHSLQCCGAIAFTDEHVHHRYSRRIHTLDAVLGTMYALERELGGALVEGGIAPRCVEVWRPGSR